MARALEAAIEGASTCMWGRGGGWRPFWRIATMAWTPGLTLDYARALSMLADPRPGWVRMARLALRQMVRSRRRWKVEEAAAHVGDAAPEERDAPPEVVGQKAG